MTAKKQNPFKLKELRGVNPEYIRRLEARGIKSAEQMLTSGRTQKERATLARETSVPEEAVLELVKLSDLTRLPGVKGIRARLYYDAGVDSIEKMANWEPEALRLMVAEYVERIGFDGILPLPKEVTSTIANARKLSRIIEN